MRTPHKLAQGLLARDLMTWVRVEFLGAATGLGLLEALREPRTEAALARDLGITNIELLGSLLSLGESLGELERADESWTLCGRRAKAFSDPAVEGLAGLVQEAVAYDADAYRGLPGRLRGDPSGDYLAEHGPLVATASRAAEPVLAALVRDLVGRSRPRRLLDVGCGTGIYLRCAGEASESLNAVGIDVDPSVVELARRNLQTWGLASRFEVKQADLRSLPPELEGPWDMILLFQNLYYFAPDERHTVLTRLRNLAPNGVLAVATAVADSGDAIARHLDLVLRSTIGNYPLSTTAEIGNELRSAGFATLDQRRLAPRQPLRAFIAS